MLLVVFATLLTFWPVCRNGFVELDDHHALALEPLFNPPTWHSLRTWWSRPTYERYHAPLTHTLWGAVALVARGARDPVTGYTLRPGPFHALSLALHVVSAIAVFEILELLVARPWPAAAGALLFALHPVQVESVAWIATTNTVLSGAMSLLALWLYLRAQSPGDSPAHAAGRRICYVSATLLFLLALFSKPIAVVVPALAATLDLLVLRRPPRRVAISLAAWFLLAFLWLLHTHHVGRPAPVMVAQPWWFAPLVAADAIAFYLYKLVCPIWLSIYYGRSPEYIERHDWAYYTWLVPIGLALALHRLRPPRIIWAGVLLFLIALLPVLGFIPFDFQAYSTVADRYLYLPMLGPALCAAWLLARPWASAPARSTKITLAVSAVLLLLGAWSAVQITHWRDTDALFRQAYRVHPWPGGSLDQHRRAAGQS